MSTSVSTPSNRDSASTAVLSGDAPAPGDVSDPRDVSAQRELRRQRRVKRWVLGLAAFALVGLLFLLIRIQGHVSGVEFAPSHFQQRSFSFFEIPLLHLQITPIRRSAQTPATANYLRVNSLIQTTPGAPPSWHLVSISRGLTGATPADAQLLVSQLHLDVGGDEYWRSWSINHPQHAKRFWPIIQDLAVRELYILMPPLFEIAQRQQNPSELQEAIESHLKREYRSLIQDLRSSQQEDLANQILREAVEDFPDDEGLLELRSSDSDSLSP